MSGNDTTPMSLAAARLKKGETDWERLRADEGATDEDDFDVDWSTLEVVLPAPKKMISLRLDQDVLDFFKRSGKGYQTRMNAVLRAYKDSQEQR